MAFKFFKKKEEKITNEEVPVSQVLSMKAQGMTNTQIANQLRAQGYSLTQIRDAIAQAEIKSAVVPSEPPLPPPPTPEVPELPPIPPSPPVQEMPKPEKPEIKDIDKIVNELQIIIENIIEEKWKGVEDRLSELKAWKAKVDEKVNALNAKVSELTSRIDDFSKVMVEKTEEYKETMGEVGAQMEAIERLMGKLVPSLAEEINELRKIVEKMKKK